MINSISGGTNLTGQVNYETRRPSPEEMFKKMDVNGDGSVDKSEMQSVIGQIRGKDGDSIDISDMFSKMDADGDGKITEKEHNAAIQQMGKGGPPPKPNPEEMFAEMDANGDGTIDKDEMESFMAQMPSIDGNKSDLDELFSQIDTDGNGEISEDEFMAAEAERESKMQGMEQQNLLASDDNFTLDLAQVSGGEQVSYSTNGQSSNHIQLKIGTFVDFLG